MVPVVPVQQQNHHVWVVAQVRHYRTGDGVAGIYCSFHQDRYPLPQLAGGEPNTWELSWGGLAGWRCLR